MLPENLGRSVKPLIAQVRSSTKAHVCLLSNASHWHLLQLNVRTVGEGLSPPARKVRDPPAHASSSLLHSQPLGTIAIALYFWNHKIVSRQQVILNRAFVQGSVPFLLSMLVHHHA
jgi:hypothetical protein